MKLGELFIKLGVKGDTKKLDEAKQKLEQVQKTSEKTSQKKIKQDKKEVKSNNDITKAIQGISNATKSLSGGLKGTGGAISALGAMGGAAGGAIIAVGALVTAITMVYGAVDRMVSSLAQANQQMITFQRTSGISLASLNKYASANAAVNYNSSIEGTAQSMQRVAQNLWEIRMGRGDVSPYQELAFVGGKAFNPMGMSVEEVIENVREAIKGVNDVQATNIITRMGFSPDDLLMLRLSREEFEKINDQFLNPEQREAMNKYALELKQIQLGFQKINQMLTIDLAKPFISLSKAILKIWEVIYKVTIKPMMARFKILYETLKGIIKASQDWIRVLADTFGFLKPILAVFRAIYLIFEDIATYMAGGESYFGDFVEAISNASDQILNSFDSSSIGEFFKNIENGLKSLSQIQIPEWLSNMFKGNWAVAIPGVQFIKMFEELSKGYDQLKQHLAPPIDTNSVSSNSSNNLNINNNFTISTNQPVDVVAANLINRFTPTQVQYGIAAG